MDWQVTQSYNLLLAYTSKPGQEAQFNIADGWDRAFFDAQPRVIFRKRKDGNWVVVGRLEYPDGRLSFVYDELRENHQPWEFYLAYGRMQGRMLELYRSS